MKKLNVNMNGNKKLQNNENIRFMIWNLPAVKTCPFRTAACEKSCYAKKAERVYPQVLPSRENNFQDSLQADFVENMIFTIEKELNSKKCAEKKVVFRIHESGDFYNLEYTQKWIEIARYFENDNRIVFLAYTKSIWYFINLGYGYPGFPGNLVIRSSLWNDTKQDKIDLTAAYHIPVYTALSAADMDAAQAAGRIFEKCDCVNCGTCKKCWDKSAHEIICKIH
jgi:hypothetical protein